MVRFSTALLLFFITTSLQAAESEMGGQLITECEYCTKCIIAIHNELESLVEAREPVTEEWIENFYTHNLTSLAAYFEELNALILHLKNTFFTGPFDRCFLGNLLALKEHFEKHRSIHGRRMSHPRLQQLKTTGYSDMTHLSELPRRHSHSGLPRSPLSHPSRFTVADGDSDEEDA